MKTRTTASYRFPTWSLGWLLSPLGRAFLPWPFMLDSVAVGEGIFETVEDAGCRIRTGDPLNPIQVAGGMNKMPKSS